MTKLYKNYFLFILIGVLIFIYLGLNYFIPLADNKEVFNKNIRESEVICVERAREDNRDYSYCREISSATQLAFDKAVEESKNNNENVFLYLIIFLLSIGIYKMMSQIAELKEKLHV